MTLPVLLSSVRCFSSLSCRSFLCHLSPCFSMGCSSNFCYEINKHTEIYSFISSTLCITHKSHSQTTSKTRNNSHLSTRNINNSINSSYHDDITPIPTSNDTNDLLGDHIYAAPIAYTPSKLHICYRGLYFLSFHFHFTIIDVIV